MLQPSSLAIRIWVTRALHSLLAFLCKITLVQAVGKVVSVLLGFLPARAESSKSGAILRGEVSAVGFNSLGRSYLKPK